MAKLNRFEWLKAVTQRSDLNSSTKAVATALAVQFANDKTGELNPSQETLVEYLGNLSLATIKRCIRQLVELGWLFRTEGRGAGNLTKYDLRAPCKIIPFRRRKKGSSVSLYSEGKGSLVTQTRLTGEPSYIDEEQSKGQKAAVDPGLPDARQSDPPQQSSQPLTFVPRGICFVRDWDARLEQEGLPTLERSLPLSPHKHHLGFWLPARTPAPMGSAEWQSQLRFVRAAIAEAQTVGERRLAG
ncbi:helix-turn-helix domain-containing protein [Phaeobacter sp. LSS9]|uniref:helix-turn-helix domain-containing protein n=1 Tax=unclassified Phaeobacter TaxID=2621772 RepID=UPI000E4B92F0|nr:helix-turn-helix domain-containing protein [Phaeobacter sp. LSS9]AXT35610.1 helix-turn-helix domain-containing protein [Phaeobacter sp. LSS9]